MSKKYIIILVVALFLLASCTKEIDIDLNSSNPQLVIEGSISDEPGPYFVKLSKTVNFSESNYFPPVTGALVIVSDNTGGIDTLSETASGLYQTHSITGTQGNTYTLQVNVDGKLYNAFSTMPFKVNLDSILFNQSTSPGSDDITFEPLPIYTDPLPKGNSYQFHFSANGETNNLFLVYNDNVGNGTVNQRPLDLDDVELHTDDSVSITMLCIDVNTYLYYYTLSRITGNGPGGGATPSNPSNNITGNKALGIFTAFTTQTKSAIVK